MIDNLLNNKVFGVKSKNDAIFYNRFYKENDRIKVMNDVNKSSNKGEHLFMLKFLGVSYNKKLKLLDVGCGGGGFLYFASQRVLVYGNEISSYCVKYAKKLCPEADIRLAPVEKLPFPDEYFDFVTALGTMEHFIDIEQSLNEMRRVLKRKGKILIHVPNIFFIFGVLKIGFFGGEPSHGTQVERFNTLDGWQRIIEESGFKVIKRDGYNRSFPLSLSDIKRPIRAGGKVGWWLIARILPAALSYNLVYVAMKR